MSGRQLDGDRLGRVAGAVVRVRSEVQVAEHHFRPETAAQSAGRRPLVAVQDGDVSEHEQASSCVTGRVFCYVLWLSCESYISLDATV